MIISNQLWLVISRGTSSLPGDGLGLTAAVWCEQLLDAIAAERIKTRLAAGQLCTIPMRRL
jgi:hypothetical protein